MMDKIEWLRQLTDKQPDDASSWYWLGVELEQAERPLEAIQAFTRGIGCAEEETLRGELLGALSRVTAGLQAGNAAPERPAAGAVKEQPGEAPSYGDDRAQYEYDAGAEDDAAAAAAPTGFRPQLVKVHPGLRVIDGGKTPEPSAQPAVPPITFVDVAGLEELKKTIRLKIISPFFNQGLFAKFRKKAGGGVLLYGPPGCGKTYIARATAGECRANFVTVHITDILDPYIGVSEQNLKDLFDKARYKKPSIMFFDEIDAIGFNRSKSSSHMRGLVDTFLTEMEGIDTSTEQVLIIGATNMPWDVDNALKRPGRFDRMVFVGPPDEAAREQMFRMQLEPRFTEPVDTAKLAKATEFFSGADIENVCELAAERVLGDIMETGVERPIGMRDLEAALADVQPSTLEWLRTAKNYVKYANQSGLYNDVESYLRQFGRKL